MGTTAVENTVTSGRNTDTDQQVRRMSVLIVKF